MSAERKPGQGMVNIATEPGLAEEGAEVLGIAPSAGSSREFEGEVVGFEPVMGDSTLLSVAVPANVVRESRPGRWPWPGRCRHCR